MLTKLFWVLLVISLTVSFVYRAQIKNVFANNFLNRNKDNVLNNHGDDGVVKDYQINNLSLATGTVITLKDKEYIYTFIKRLESHNNQSSISDKLDLDKEKLKFVVLSVNYDSYGDIYLHLNNGEIRLNIFNDLDTVWNDYLSAIGDSKLSYKLKNERNSLTYLDLRFPNKLFYKFNTYDKRILGTSTISSSTTQ